MANRADKKVIMTRAHEIKRVWGVDFSIALRRAWAEHQIGNVEGKSPIVVEMCAENRVGREDDPQKWAQSFQGRHRRVARRNTRYRQGINRAAAAYNATL